MTFADSKPILVLFVLATGYTSALGQSAADKATQEKDYREIASYQLNSSDLANTQSHAWLRPKFRKKMPTMTIARFPSMRRCAPCKRSPER